MRVPADYDIHGNLRVINAGSVGMPFGEPGAYWGGGRCERSILYVVAGMLLVSGGAVAQGDVGASRTVQA